MYSKRIKNGNIERTIKKTHHWHAFKRFQDRLEIKREMLVTEMGIIQVLIFANGQRKVLNGDVIGSFSKTMSLNTELIKELEEDPMKVIVENNTFEKGNNNVGYLEIIQ